MSYGVNKRVCDSCSSKFIDLVEIGWNFEILQIETCLDKKFGDELHNEANEDAFLLKIY